MGTKIYNKLPKCLKEIVDHKAFKKQLKLFLLQTFSQWKNLHVFSALPVICI
jgi:hypothetical protein